MARNHARKRLRAAAAQSRENPSLLFTAKMALRILAVLLPSLTIMRLAQRGSFEATSTNELMAMIQSTMPQSFELSFPGANSSASTTNLLRTGDNNDNSNNKPQYKYRKYVELQDEVEKASKKHPMPDGHRQENSWSAFHRATLVERAPWLPRRKKCKETCCVETVAISLDQDDHQLINTRDGIELSDLVLPHGRIQADKMQPDHLYYFARTLDKAMLPCIVPGTIIGIENHNDLTVGFFHEYRPNIKVPYIISTTGSDGDAPNVYEEYIKDPLLIKWYGTNPIYRTHTDFRENVHKFEPLNLGLSFQHPHERNLLPYLKLNHFINPFLDKSKWDLSKNKLDFNKDVFVHFGVRTLPRKDLWRVLCPTFATDKISCNQETEKIKTHDIYKEMSQFRFGVSPPGMGFDCYRTYEMFLLGVIPVVEDQDILSHRLFEGMPVVFVHNLASVTSRQEILDAIESYIASPKFQNATFEEGWGRLFLKHKRQQMLKDANRVREIVEDEQGKKYYQAYRYSVVGASDNSVDEAKLKALRAPWFDDPQPKFEPGEEGWIEDWKDKAVFKNYG
ncbi:expressed unknown protein [Seminavis robusta]|uniref:Exostosin GT47 domain-containing protein n=1 Tax=Seminavis robusta TaxID=568900 RepID=A0A9N8H8P6_9STRA|nr:expressed unknown protein [Seminavis robusta]|eukprot:Sro176_g077570.1 n/a (564) ;mRNA; f:91776-93467